LCSIEKWGEKWEDINLERLYILLREQLAQPNDPWVVETLLWWNKFRTGLSSILLCSHDLLEKYSVKKPMSVAQKHPVHRAQPCGNGWKMSGRRGCEWRHLTGGKGALTQGIH